MKFQLSSMLVDDLSPTDPYDTMHRSSSFFESANTQSYYVIKMT